MCHNLSPGVVLPKTRNPSTLSSHPVEIETESDGEAHGTIVVRVQAQETNITKCVDAPGAGAHLPVVVVAPAIVSQDMRLHNTDGMKFLLPVVYHPTHRLLGARTNRDTRYHVEWLPNEVDHLDFFEQRTINAMKYGAEVGLPMLRWLAMKTENSEIHRRMELPLMRRQLSRIISVYPSSELFRKFKERVAYQQAVSSRTETALQVAERQMDSPNAGYYSRAHPEIASFLQEDWGADHTDNLRRTSIAAGYNITDAGSICLEVIAPELILLWIMEDLAITAEEATHIQQSPLAMEYGRLVLEDECIIKQVSHETKAHSRVEGLDPSRQRRRRQPRNFR